MAERPSRLVFRAVRHSFRATVGTTVGTTSWVVRCPLRRTCSSDFHRRGAYGDELSRGTWAVVEVFEKAGNLTCAKPPLTGASVISLQGADNRRLWRRLRSIPNKRASLDTRTESRIFRSTSCQNECWHPRERAVRVRTCNCSRDEKRHLKSRSCTSFLYHPCHECHDRNVTCTRQDGFAMACTSEQRYATPLTR